MKRRLAYTLALVFGLAMVFTACGGRGPYARVYGGGGRVVVGGGGGVSYGSPNYGSLALAAGFMPDPAGSRGLSGGPVSAQSVNGGCRGWIAQNPDHVLQLTTPMNFFRIFVHANQDTTLVVITPDGQVMCNDDGGNGLNPMVQNNYWAPGNYYIWVGSYQAGVNAPYQIGFTELNNI